MIFSSRYTTTVASLLGLASLVGCAAESSRSEKRLPERKVSDSVEPENRSSEKSRYVRGELLSLPPMWRLISEHPEAFGTLHQDAVDKLHDVFRSEFSLPGEPNPRRFVDAMVAALRSFGISNREVYDTVETFIQGGISTFSQQGEALDHLDGLLPIEAKQRSDLIDSPGGVIHDCGMFIEWRSSYGDPFGLDLLEDLRFEKNDPTWLPENNAPLSPQLHLNFLKSRHRELSAGFAVRAQGEVSIWCERDMHRRISCETFDMTFNLNAEAPNVQTAILSLAIPPQVSGNVIAHVLYNLRGLGSGDGATDNSVGAMSSKSWVRFEPRAGEDGRHLGWRGVPLGQRAQELPYPALASYPLVEFARMHLFYSKDVLQKRAIDAEEVHAARSTLLGRSLASLEMAYDPKTGEPFRLLLSEDTRSILFFGASWCEPCASIAPHVKSFVSAIQGSGSTDTVYRISIDDDEAVFPEVVRDRYPDGAISSSQLRALGLTSVPAYLIIENGMVSEWGTLTSEVLDRLSPE